MSKQQLTIENLAPYLPYDLKVNRYDAYEFFNPLDLMGFSYGKAEICNEGILSKDVALDKIKPILRPLSDLTKEIEHNGESFVPIEYIKKEWGYNEFEYLGYKKYAHSFKLEENNPAILHLPYCFLELFLKWHFDVFSLIEKGLAININDLDDDKRRN